LSHVQIHPKSAGIIKTIEHAKSVLVLHHHFCPWAMNRV
jgi:hypothetical protein